MATDGLELSVLGPLDQGSLSFRVFSMLREALAEGLFRPGERIVVQDLADRLGTSVTPVREACLRLVSERGLEVRSGRFVAVPALTRARYLEIRTIRMPLEGLAAELAAGQATKAEIDQLSDVQTRFEAAQRDRDFAAENRLNRNFHLEVYRLSRMPMLVSHIEGLWVSMGPILKVYHEDINADASIANEHRNVIDALRAGDGIGARVALERDLISGGEGILRYLENIEMA